MITAFLPCRSGSQRVKNKNTKEFCLNTGKSLFDIKMEQLINVDLFDKIIVSTNDPSIKEQTQKFLNDKRVLIDDRPNFLANSSTKTDDLIKYVPQIITEGDVLWTHVTSPFVDHTIYKEAIIQHQQSLKDGYDSLMSVKEFKAFFWNKEGPINYNPVIDKWPKTQDIEPIFEINSGIFIANYSIYKTLDDRIGNKPFLFKMDNLASLDIDWEEDFNLSQQLYNNKSTK